VSNHSAPPHTIILPTRLLSIFIGSGNEVSCGWSSKHLLQNDTQAPLSYLPDLDGNNAPTRPDSLLC
jgi:hypothetical protein